MVKGITYVDDQAQQIWTEKQDYVSPTIQEKFYSMPYYQLMYQATEESGVTTYTLPGYFFTERYGRTRSTMHGWTTSAT